MKSIFFITGVSCSGKTTVLNGLKKLLDPQDFEFSDMDENGGPIAEGFLDVKGFIKTKISNVIYKAKKSEKIFIFSGIIDTETVKTHFPDITEYLSPSYILLDAGDALESRLRARGVTSESQIQKTKDVARFFRVKGVDRHLFYRTDDYSIEGISKSIAQFIHDTVFGIDFSQP